MSIQFLLFVPQVNEFEQMANYKDKKTAILNNDIKYDLMDVQLTTETNTQTNSNRFPTSEMTCKVKIYCVQLIRPECLHF